MVRLWFLLAVLVVLLGVLVGGKMLGLWVLLAVLAVLWQTRRYWMSKRCPACRYFVPALAMKCAVCHEYFPQATAVLVLLGMLGSGVSLAVAEPLTLLPCASVHFFADPCGEDGVEPVSAPRPPAPPAPAYELFPKDTMAKDTPPLMVNVFNDPSDANVDAYLEWHDRKAARLKVVQTKLQERAVLREQRLRSGGGR